MGTRKLDFDHNRFNSYQITVRNEVDKCWDLYQLELTCGDIYYYEYLETFDG